MARKNPAKAMPDRRRKPPPSPAPSPDPTVALLPFGRRESDAELERMRKWVSIADDVLKGHLARPKKGRSTDKI